MRPKLTTLIAGAMVFLSGAVYAAVTQPFYFDVTVPDTFSVEELDTLPAHIEYSGDSKSDHVVAVITDVPNALASDFAALKSTPGSVSKKTFTITPEHGALVGENDSTQSIAYTLSYRKDGSPASTNISSSGTSFNWTPTTSQLGKDNQVCVFAVAIEPTLLEGKASDTYSDYMHVEMAVE